MNYKNKFYGCAFTLVMVSAISLTTFIGCEQSAKDDALKIKQVEHSRVEWKRKAENLQNETYALGQRIQELETQLENQPK